jgi:regulatory protein
MQAYTVRQAFVKMASFCAYQERCHQEVKEKLQTFSLTPDEQDEVVSLLIEENFLNEQRFAIAFAGGKFRVKDWGKIKIKHELQLRKVSPACIQKALQAIETVDYEAKLADLITEKIAQLNLRPNKISPKDKQKIYQYLLTKGYESDLISKIWQHHISQT